MGKNYDICGSDTYQLRCRFLKNLATVIADLRNLSFDKIGMFHFDKDPDERDALPPTVGCQFEVEGARMHILAERSTSRKFYGVAIGSCEIDTIGDDDSESAACKGYRHFWDITSRYIPGVKDFAETFVLTHPESGFQNIICSDNGEINGIID